MKIETLIHLENGDTYNICSFDGKVYFQFRDEKPFIFYDELAGRIAQALSEHAYHAEKQQGLMAMQVCREKARDMIETAAAEF
jgi:predicted Fe-Mo cluster-binding NifX family protein